MPNSSPTRGPGSRVAPCRGHLPVTVLIALILLVQPACLFRKKKSAVPVAVPPTPVRVVLLPFNLPADNTDLRWAALAAPILMAKTMESAQDLEVVPIWQGMPIAAEALGQSREITPEIAAYVASRLAAKWSTQGQLSPAKDGVSLLLDLIPTKANLIAFRYQKELRVDALGTHFHDAVNQFLSYLVARPLGKSDSRLADASSMKELASAIDREYGWFAVADPGKAEALVSNLMRTDPKLARFLFNPGLYPGVGTASPKPKPIDLRTIPPPPAEKPATEPPAPPKVQVPPSSPPPEARTEELSVAVPPPRTFSQKMESPPPPPTVETQHMTHPEPPPPAVAPPGARPLESPATARSNPQREEIPSRPIPRTRAVSRTSEVAPFAPVVEKAQTALKVATGTNSEEPSASRPSSQKAGGFKIQVYASRNKEDAGAKARFWEREGHGIEIDEVELKEKGAWYRVRLTGYESRRAAKEAADKLVSAGRIREYWIIP